MVGTAHDQSSLRVEPTGELLRPGLTSMSRGGSILEKERQTVTLKEMAYSNYLSIEAIVNLLVRKGLMSKGEVLEEIKRLKHKQHIKPN